MPSPTFNSQWSAPPTTGDDVTSLAVTIPGTAAAQPCLILFGWSANPGTIGTLPTGWTEQFLAPSALLAGYRKDIGAAESTPTFTWTNSVNPVALCLRFTANVSAWSVKAPANATSLNGSIDPPAVTISPSGSPGLALTYLVGNDARRTVTAGPSGYTLGAAQDNGDAADAYGRFASLYLSAPGGSEDPSTFTISGGPTSIWDVQTLYIYESAAAGGKEHVHRRRSLRGIIGR